MHHDPRAGALITGLAIAGLLAACAPTAAAPTSPAVAASQVVTAPPAAAVSPITSAIATPHEVTAPPATPTPSPHAMGNATYVVGWEVCMPPGYSLQTPDTTGTTRVRDGGFTCTDDMNDPRVTGTAHGEWKFDGWGNGLQGALVQWSERMVLENDGGSWVGTYAGFYTPETGDNIVIWYEGEGGYAGLSYVQWIQAPPGHVTSGTTVYGLIFPGGLPPAVEPAKAAP